MFPLFHIFLMEVSLRGTIQILLRAHTQKFSNSSKKRENERRCEWWMVNSEWRMLKEILYSFLFGVYYSPIMICTMHYAPFYTFNTLFCIALLCILHYSSVRSLCLFSFNLCFSSFPAWIYKNNVLPFLPVFLVCVAILAPSYISPLKKKTFIHKILCVWAYFFYCLYLMLFSCRFYFRFHSFQWFTN